MMEELANRYFRDVGEHKILSPEEVRKLSEGIHDGNQGSLNELVKHNLRFVIKIAKEYLNHGLPFSDIIQEGNLGLIKAAKLFDPKRGLEFDTYAIWWIKSSIQEALDNSLRTIRLPRNKIKDLRKKKNTEKKLSGNGTYITSETLSQKTGIPIEKIRELENLPQTEPLPTEYYGKDFLHKGIQMNPLRNEELKEEVEHFLQWLSPKEKIVLEHRYGLNGYEKETLEQIGKRMSMTKEGVRYIQNKAIQKLRKTKEIKSLKRYLYQ